MESSDNQAPWSEIDILNLLKYMQYNIPSDDFREFKISQADLDWSKVAFGRFSGEMCKQKWMEISCKLRKFCTLTELVLEAKELMKKTHKNNPVKKHPDRPKRPLTAYLRFYKEQRPKYCQMYPKYSNVQLTKILADKYRQLPAEIKQRYIQDFKKEKQEFQKKMTQFKENHRVSRHPQKSVVPGSHQTKVSKKSQGVTKNIKSLCKTEFHKTFSSEMTFHGEPRKPPMNAYHKFHQDSWSSPELRHLSFRERFVEISRLWHQVPEDMKEQYTRQAVELQKQYWVELDLWLKTLSSEEYAAYQEAKTIRSKRKNMSMSGGRSHKFRRTDDLQSSSEEEELQVKPGEGEELLDPGTDSPYTNQSNHGGSQAWWHLTDDSEEEDSSTSSDSSSTDEDDENLPQGNPHV
ncbi:upstream-binding factor 1-like protein 1 [Grammomys surdaster]|uniref:upstream-binding factor 1-like protein 1 n=1 Tax=Grammomys surdaster TaxID=491861 RepID=UPI0010A017C0|nr:upstream-binding factor 1-like protein 1 [Grammomys surdaster]